MDMFIIVEYIVAYQCGRGNNMRNNFHRSSPQCITSYKIAHVMKQICCKNTVKNPDEKFTQCFYYQLCNGCSGILVYQKIFSERDQYIFTLFGALVHHWITLTHEWTVCIIIRMFKMIYPKINDICSSLVPFNTIEAILIIWCEPGPMVKMTMVWKLL